MNKIEKGSIVQLKSGGPRMTVIEIEDENVDCQWFDKTTVKKEIFSIHSLVISQRRSMTYRVGR